MQESLYQSDTNQGEITSKGLPDHDEFARRRNNAALPAVAQGCYPGGENPQNLHIMPHELVVARRDGNCYDMGNEPNQQVFSSLSGFYHKGYGSIEAAMRNHVLAGIAKTVYKVDSYDQTESGVTFYVAGSGSIVNNGHGDIYPGDWVEWYFPDTYESLLARPDRNRPAGIDPRIVYQNHAGEPNTKVLIEVRRFDPRNFSTCLAGVWSVITRPANNTHMPDDGIGGLTYERLQHTRGHADAVNLETLQEEALGFQNSIIMMAALMGRFMVNIHELDLTTMSVQKICEYYGLWTDRALGDKDDTKAAQRAELLSIVFRSYLTGKWRRTADNVLMRLLVDGQIPTGPNADGVPEGEFKAALKGHYASDSKQMTYRLAADPLGILMGAVTSAQQARRSRILGKALSSAGQSETLHIMLGHFRGL